MTGALVLIVAAAVDFAFAADGALDALDALDAFLVGACDFETIFVPPSRLRGEGRMAY
jgi:hypothetical protein